MRCVCHILLDVAHALPLADLAFVAQATAWAEAYRCSHAAATIATCELERLAVVFLIRNRLITLWFASGRLVSFLYAYSIMRGGKSRVCAQTCEPLHGTPESPRDFRDIAVAVHASRHMKRTGPYFRTHALVFLTAGWLLQDEVLATKRPIPQRFFLGCLHWCPGQDARPFCPSNPTVDM